MPARDCVELTRRINLGIGSLPPEVRDQALGSCTLDIPQDMRELGLDTTMLGPASNECQIFSVIATRTLLHFFARFENYWSFFRGLVTLPRQQLAEFFFLSATRDEQRRIASEAETALRTQRDLDPETRALIRRHHELAQQQSVDLRQGNPFSELFTALYEDAEIESEFDISIPIESSDDAGGVEEIHFALLALLLASDQHLRADWYDSVSAIAAH